MENKNLKEVTIKIEGQEWADALDKAFEKANKKAKIDGFRPGKAPKEFFLKKYGQESLFMDAGDIVLEGAYKKVMEANQDLELVAQPEIDLKSVNENGIEFIFKLSLKPEVKLGEYKNLKIKKEKNEVTKEEIDKTIDEMKNKYAENVVKEGFVTLNDIAIIDFEGFKDDVAFAGGKGENYSLKIGSGSFIPGFEEQLIGMSKGEERTIKVTFPEEYQSEELKGADATFKVTIKEIKEIVVPEINEEFFADLAMDGVTTEAELRKQVEETIKARKEVEIENKYVDALLAKVAGSTEVEVPHAMVHEEIHRMIHQYEEHLKMQGITLEQFYQFTNSSQDALEEQMTEEATNRVKYRLMLEEIAKVEKIEITDIEAQEETTLLADKYQMEEEEFLKLFGGIDMIKYDLRMRKAIEILKGN